jgi:hypothetical protein
LNAPSGAFFLFKGKIMTVLLSRTYAGYPSGNTIQVPTNTETALAAQGFGSVASTSASAAPTVGAVTSNVTSGRVAVGAGSSSVVVTNNLVDVNSKIYAVVNQAAADTTFTSVVRVVPAAGSFTIFGPANATATTVVDWVLFQLSGDTQPINT